MSYNGKVWNAENSGMDNISERHIDIQIPNEVMEQLYIPERSRCRGRSFQETKSQ